MKYHSLTGNTGLSFFGLNIQKTFDVVAEMAKLGYVCLVDVKGIRRLVPIHQFMVKE